MPPRSLAAERTALAWQRTGLAGAVIGGLGVLTAATHRGLATLLVASAATVWCAVVGGVLALRPLIPLAARLPSPWWHLLLTASIPVVLAVAGVLLAMSW